MIKPIFDTEILLSTYEERIWDVLERVEEWAKSSHVLIVHQTHNVELANSISLLVSQIENVRYVVQGEYGVAKSRNLALTEAKGELLLFVDDDVKLVPDFYSRLLKAYEEYPNADVISFAVKDSNSDKLTKDFPSSTIFHNKFTILKVGTIEISLRKSIIDKGVRFPENLGAGTTLPLCDEPVFLSRLMDHGATLLYVPDIIVSHPIESSGRNIDEYNKLKSRFVAFNYIYGCFFGRVFFLLFSLKNIRKINKLSWVVSCVVGK